MPALEESSREKHVSSKSTRRRKWRFGILLFLLLLLGVLTFLWKLWGLHPQHHFQIPDYKNAMALPQPVAIEPAIPLDERSDGDSHPSPEPSAVPSPDPAPTTGAAATKPSQLQPKRSANSFNVVLIGTDSWGEAGARADTIMAAHVMPDQRKVNIVSIPRDTRVYVQGAGYTKINHAHIVGENKGGNKQGTLLLVQAVSDFLGIPVHHYMKTNFEGVIDFIDSIGGVDMMVEQDVTITPEITIRAGWQRLDGQHVLFLARERYSLADGDFGRQREQFRIVRALAKQLLRPEHLLDLAGLLKSGRSSMLDTSFRDSDLISLAWLFSGMEADDFAYEQIPGRDLFARDPLVGSEVYYWNADPVQVRSIRERLFLE
ncbi:LCP family protein [Paenibacillus koleovorans]|uniref:LCP family protein n=1 Tax=Paenibacillus koleovorans TaxID=121608 RepID=UPI001FE684CD|nr:LCP family protein [Paenibacillus koleovorans]